MRYIVLIIFLPLILAGCINNNTVVEDNSNVTQEEVQKEEEQVKYNMEELAKHNNADDCWLLIDEKVYDVTSFIAGGKHGGGDAILEGCGIDSTELYKTRPMGSGTEHSEKAYGFLNNFYIADLEK